MERNLGKLRFRFTEKRVYGQFEDAHYMTKYRVLWESSDQLVIVRGPKEHEEVQHLHFTGPDEFWVGVGPNLEWFIRDRAPRDLKRDRTSVH